MTIFITIQSKGGPGSGNYGHRGIPGKVGGSSPRSMYNVADYTDLSKLTRQIFEDMDKGKVTSQQAADAITEWQAANPSSKPKSSIKKTDEPRDISDESALDDLGLEKSLWMPRLRHLEKVEQDWTMAGDPDAKIDIIETLNIFPELNEIRMYQLYGMLDETGSKSKAGFAKFKRTPITMYRGGRPEYGQTFSTFTLSRGVAESFAKKHGSGLFKATVKPEDLLGFIPTGATELLVSAESQENVVEIGSKQIYSMVVRV